MTQMKSINGLLLQAKRTFFSERGGKAIYYRKRVVIALLLRGLASTCFHDQQDALYHHVYYQ